MKSSAKKVELAPYDDLFSTEESRQDAKLEKVREIPLSELHPFKNHPFKVKDDEAMMETADSVRQYSDWWAGEKSWSFSDSQSLTCASMPLDRKCGFPISAWSRRSRPHRYKQ